MKSIVLFASGSGSNVENIVQYFHNKPNVRIACVLTNKRDAKVLDRCDKLKINALYFNKTSFTKGNTIVDILNSFAPDLIVLAGFLWKIPESMIINFPKKIINIHPALLPKYGGKGMFGSHVHRAVKENKEEETGITIHYVNQNYDEGAIIHQEKTIVLPEDSADDIAKKVLSLEHSFFPSIIENILDNQ